MMEKQQVKNPVWRLILAYIAILFLLLMIALMSSCSTERKIRKAQDIAFRYPDSFARFCAIVYPVKDSIGKPQIEYIPADNKNYEQQIDSLTAAVNDLQDDVSVDTNIVVQKYKDRISKLAAQVKSLQDKYKPCVPDTIRVTLPVYRENTAKVKDLELKLGALTKLYDKVVAEKEVAEKKASTRLWILIGIGGLVALVVGLKLSPWKIPFIG